VPVVCRAAAAEVVEADIDVAAPKGGIAHLRFKRGSVHKVGVPSPLFGRCHAPLFPRGCTDIHISISILSSYSSGTG
jgi:hypothetical protein